MSRFAFVSVALLTGALALPALAAVFDPPPRKPGLWTMTNTVAGRTLSSQLCLDAAVDKKLTVMGQAGGKSCSVMDMTRTPDGMKFHSVCKGPGGGTMTMDGAVKGDYSSHYGMTADTVTTGSSIAMLNKTSHMQMTARWTGPCAPGQKPGDMILPGGMKVNILAGMQ